MKTEVFERQRIRKKKKKKIVGAETPLISENVFERALTNDWDCYSRVTIRPEPLFYSRTYEERGYKPIESKCETYTTE